MRTIDGAGVDGVHRGPVEPEAVHHPGRVVLDDDVGPRDEPLGQVEPARVGEVEGDAALVDVDVQEEAAALPPPVPADEVAGGRRAHAVDALDRLDVDHVGAERGEQAGRRRARPPAGEVEHLEPGHGQTRRRQAGAAGRTSGPRSCPCARRAAGAGARGAEPLAVDPVRRAGAAGTRPDGDGGVHLPRGEMLVGRGGSGPLPTGATGMRNSDACSMTSSVVCWRSTPAALPSSSGCTRGVHPDHGLARTMSARPMSTRKSSNIWAALVLNPTHPSVVGSMDGNSTTRGGCGSGGPADQAHHQVGEQVGADAHHLGHRHVDVRALAGPLRVAHRGQARRPRRRRRRPTRRCGRPACTGGRSIVSPRPERTALGLHGELRRRPSAHGPATERGDRHHDQPVAWLGSGSSRRRSITRSAPAMQLLRRADDRALPRGEVLEQGPVPPPSSTPDADQRSGSPSRGSTLTTSAPASANSLAA